MSPLVVTLIGLALLVLGVVSRRPWGRWWGGGGAPSEQFATLIAPPGGLAVACAGLGIWVGERSALTPVVGAVAILAGMAMVWTVLSLPVPDRVLVKGSFIRADRRRRRQRRQERRERRRRGRSAD